MKQPVQEFAVIDAVQSQRAILLILFCGRSEEFSPENFRRTTHSQGTTLITLFEAIKTFFIFHFLEFRRLFECISPHKSSLTTAQSQTKFHFLNTVIRRPLIKNFHTVFPFGNLTCALPLSHFSLGPGVIRDPVHELRIFKIPLPKGVGNVVPEFDNVCRRRRPKRQRIKRIDLPTR